MKTEAAGHGLGRVVSHAYFGPNPLIQDRGGGSASGSRDPSDLVPDNPKESKLDSRLREWARSGREQPVVVDATANGSTASLVSDLKEIEATITASAGALVSAKVPANKLGLLETMDSLRFARAPRTFPGPEDLTPTQASVPTQAGMPGWALLALGAGALYYVYTNYLA
jgi:hypothetical protein